VGGLPAPLGGLAGTAQQPVERGDRAQVAALIQQDRPHLGRGQLVEDRLLLGGAERAWLASVTVPDRRRPRRCRTGAVAAVATGQLSWPPPGS